MKDFMNKLKKLKQYPIIVLFFAFIFIFTIIDVIKPDKEFSELENKFLQEKPNFTLTSFYYNEYVPKYEKYINEQFVLRNKWIDLKSRCEFYLGKTENNGVVYGKDGYLLDKVQTINDKQLNKNIEYIKKFLEKYNDKNINFALIPNSFEVLSEKLPYGLKLYNQGELINNVYNDLDSFENVNKLNFIDVLNSHDNEYIYYKTDHHWTTLGAYYAYVDFMKSLDKPYVDIADLKANEVEFFLGTYYSKAMKFDTEVDTITYYDINIDKMTFGGNDYSSLYDTEKFKVRDKYAAFLYGNNDLTVITSKDSVNKQNKSRILVVKDSFGNSFVPYITQSYDEVYVLDLRSSTKKVSEIMEMYNFDDILVMYSVNNFIEDINIMKLTY